MEEKPDDPIDIDEAEQGEACDPCPPDCHESGCHDIGGEG